ncbi:MAG: hypothetical protein KKA36_09050 [Gammaproteobacteria bacterium]|nr:hypothetical protein [Gammaproteobacteria bacterium]MBU2479224.1 hypothetical protein [Gammaproteobacteria bacterium]
MHQNPIGAHPRLHMGCGESLRSKLLLAVPQPLRNESVDQPPRKISAGKTKHGRARG